MNHAPIHAIDGDLARLLIESATDFAVIASDKDGIITSWNPGAETITGWTAAEAVGMDGRAIYTPEDQQARVADDEMKRALNDGRSVNERWHVRKDGTRFWGSGLLMPLRTGDGFVKLMRDRTVEREAERRYAAMSAALPCALFVTDIDGNNTETNQYFQTYTGRTAAELNGDRWAEVIHPDDRARATEVWNHAVATGEIYEARYRFRRHDGEYRCFACRGVPEHDSEGRILRWTGTCIDVDNEARARAALEKLNLSLEHKVDQGEADLAEAIEGLQAEMANRLGVEDALRQAQKLQAVGQLTGGIAHDFNNLLTIIRASVDLLRRPDLSEEKRKRYVEAIGETADRAAGLTRQLLAFARRSPLAPETFDACNRVRGLTSMLATSTGSRVKIHVECEEGSALVEADPNQFETAIVNLVVNARDAMDGEGELTIRVAAASELPARRAHPSQGGDYIAVSVADTGTGIAPDDLERVFEPFWTTKEVGQGTGLGLSQVHGFAKQSDGDVTIESELGHGTTFTIYLPRARGAAPVAKVEVPEPTLEPDGKGCILVVEDNQVVGEFAAQLLDELGYSTVWTSNAQAALDAVAEKPDRFDAVFTDVVMPGMSGVELAETIRRDYPNVPVVLTSGYSHVLAEEGAHGFTLLHKPYSLDGLARTLRQALQRP